MSLLQKTNHFLHRDCTYKFILSIANRYDSVVSSFFYKSSRQAYVLTSRFRGDNCKRSNNTSTTGVKHFFYEYPSKDCKRIITFKVLHSTEPQQILGCYCHSSLLKNAHVLSCENRLDCKISSSIVDSSIRSFHSSNGGLQSSDSDKELKNTPSSSTTCLDNKTMERLPSADEITMMNDARDIFKNAVVSVLPKEMVAKHVEIVDSNTGLIRIQDKTYQLNHNVYVVGFGKAVLGMARALDDLIGRHMVRGVVSVPRGTQEQFKNAGKIEMLLDPHSAIAVREGASNNMPDPPAHQAALEIADLAQSCGEGDLLVVLISGGGSALLPAPSPPITLDDMLLVTGQMSRSGATISQLNTVRKHLELLKGGGLAQMAHPAQVLSLIISDIVGDPLDLIASAPTVADCSAPEDCLSIFSHLNIAGKIPESVTHFLKEKLKLDNNDKGLNDASRSPMSSQKRVEFSHVQNVVIGSNKIACERACQESSTLGYSPFVLSTELEGEAKEVGKMFANLALFIAFHLEVVKTDANIMNIERLKNHLISSYGLSDSKLDEVVFHVDNSKMASRGVCIIAGGETTVTVTGTGKGGRNQEMATSAGLELDNLLKEMPFQSFNTHSIDNDGKDVDLAEDETRNLLNNSKPQIAFLSAGTDGQDGPTSAAGGVVGINFVEGVNGAGLNPNHYLDNNDCFSLLESWADGNGLVNTGLTGTNVMDLQLLIVKYSH